MIKEQIFDLTNPLVSYCIELYNKIPNNKEQIQYITSKKFIMNPIDYYKLHTKQDDINFIIDEQIDKYIGLVKEILITNGFKLDNTNSNYNAELHYGNTDENIIKSPFCIHQDDFGGVDYKVNTFIIYFDVDCEGGEIAFYKHEHAEPHLKILTQNPSKTTCKVVMFDGSLYHNPLDYKLGHRNLVSFQVPRI